VTEQRTTKLSAATGSFVDDHVVRLWLIEYCRSSEPPLGLFQDLAGHHHALDLIGALVDLGGRGPGGSFRR
jgi:hypothetical protein